jgi:predicted lysophospholipase L1 biosynthesis ABC-type transport system permease subunit
VLGALGITASQLRSVLRWQGLAFAGGGVAIGTVTGLAFGRMSWRLLATELGLSKSSCSARLIWPPSFLSRPLCFGSPLCSAANW